MFFLFIFTFTFSDRNFCCCCCSLIQMQNIFQWGSHMFCHRSTQTYSHIHTQTQTHIHSLIRGYTHMYSVHIFKYRHTMVWFWFRMVYFILTVCFGCFFIHSGIDRYTLLLESHKYILIPCIVVVVVVFFLVFRTSVM